MKKVCIVFGTRPEAIKMAPIINEFRKIEDQVELKICITAQHRQMLDQVLQFFEIKPDYDLNLMKGQQDLTDITTSVLMGLRTIFQEDRPDWVMVHGDTTTTMSASLAAFYLKIPVAHVEAGLRTYQLYSPWPEEKNRHITAALTSLHFAPTTTAELNLLAERVREENIVVTGNSVIDALFLTLNRLEENRELKEKIQSELPLEKPGLRRIVVTTHRRENFGSGMVEIFRAIRALAHRADVEVIFPVHLNPNVRGPAHEFLSGLSNVHLIEPLDYAPFVYLMSTAYLILTDSGGVQEEAPSLGVPVLVMRNSSERMEAVERGVVKLVGPNAEKIIRESYRLLDDFPYYNSMRSVQNPYGDGLASRRIVQRMVYELSQLENLVEAV